MNYLLWLFLTVSNVLACYSFVYDKSYHMAVLSFCAFLYLLSEKPKDTP